MHLAALTWSSLVRDWKQSGELQIMTAFVIVLVIAIIYYWNNPPKVK